MTITTRYCNPEIYLIILTEGKLFTVNVKGTPELSV